MKKLIVIPFLLATLLVKAQDIQVNIIAQESNSNDGIWQEGTIDATILLTFSNTNRPALGQYTLLPVIDLPFATMEFLPALQQTLLPAGWSIVFYNDSTIRLSNGTDQFDQFESREVRLKISTMDTSLNNDYQLVTVSMTEWGDGTPFNGTNFGTAPSGENSGNNSSATGITIFPATPLPVRLLSFEGRLIEGQKSLLNWNVIGEKNLEHYSIERKVNQKNFIEVGKIKANGSRSYTFTDDLKNLTGHFYYRLKMQDFNGDFQYSSTIKLHIANDFQLQGIFPNPAKDQFTVRLSTKKSGWATFILTDPTGKLVAQKTLQLEAGKQDLQFDQIQNLARGNYHLNIITDEGHFTTSLSLQ